MYHFFAHDKTTKLSRAITGYSIAALLCSASVYANPAPILTIQAEKMQTAQDQANYTKQQDYQTVISTITKDYLKLNPEMATYYGVSSDLAGDEIKSALSDFSPKGEVQRRKDFANLLKTLRSQSINHEYGNLMIKLLINQLETALAPANAANYGAVFADYGIWYLPYPVTQLSGPQVSIPTLLEKQQTIKTSQDAENYLARMDGYSKAIDDVIAKIHADKEKGVIPPDFVLKATIKDLSAKNAASANTHQLVKDFTKKLTAAGLNAEQNSPQIARAKKIVHDGIKPANDRLLTTLKNLLPHANHTAGIHKLPNGKALYTAMIEHMTDTTYTAEEIHQIGLDEVARITGEMDAILNSQGYTDGSVGDRMKQLLSEERFIYPNTDDGKKQLIADLNDQMAEIDKELPKWFGLMPKQKVEIKRVPVYNEGSAPGGFYDAPAADGSRPGTFWINLKNTAQTPSYGLTTLVYHEANPGHHFQVALGLEKNSPVITNMLYSNAFAEGWALYAEELAVEMGLYENRPFKNLGRLQAELHRAVRLVIDTGMHAKGWTREQSIDYMVNTEGTHLGEATGEVERYAVWPGQALGYKMGMIKIQDMRKKAEKALGDKFNLRAFHDTILKDGSLPLQILEGQVDMFINTHQ